MAEVSLSALIAALKRRFGGTTLDEQAEGAKEGAEQMAAAMPDAVMPHGAIEAQRRRMKMMDEMNRGQ
ncbi:MAG TPA: hypothetical protein VFT43_05335 [Candidatus Polarisedimenticolia bacterium]|nr:hypothetical protein [Candidatus Polarisedimenticolia bacterium]